jgi:hypothetical protein
MARSWKSLESMLNDLVPAAVMAQFNAVFQMAGKDKDEHYDLKLNCSTTSATTSLVTKRRPRPPNWRT